MSTSHNFGKETEQRTCASYDADALELLKVQVMNNEMKRRWSTKTLLLCGLGIVTQHLNLQVPRRFKHDWQQTLTEHAAFNISWCWAGGAERDARHVRWVSFRARLRSACFYWTMKITEVLCFSWQSTRRSHSYHSTALGVYLLLAKCQRGKLPDRPCFCRPWIWLM